ncbi:class I SAM-dependent methyltransferase [Candidatus Woesearchaeota archaeon]|nr:class I SAM-dependent methyltransferase [Candidatus Woesearchaeota archaeon]
MVKNNQLESENNQYDTKAEFIKKSRHNHDWDYLWKKTRKQMQYSIKKANYMSQRMVKEIKKHTLLNNKDCFEIGSGSGRLSWMLLKADVRSVTLLDTSKEALEIAKTLFTEKEKETKVSFLQKSIFEFPTHKKYDIVVSGATIQHFKEEDVQLILKKHLDLTRKGGVCCIIFPSSNYFNVQREKTESNRKLYGWFDTQLEKKIHTLMPIQQYVHYRFDFFYGKPKFILYLHRIIFYLFGIDLNVACLEKRFGGLVFLAFKKS